MSKQDRGPAYPVARGTAVDGSDYVDANYPGMTLRDYFAGQALAGICANLGDYEHVKWGAVAEDAYISADRMLTERAKA